MLDWKIKHLLEWFWLVLARHWYMEIAKASRRHWGAFQSSTKWRRFGFYSLRHTCLAPVSVSCFQKGLHVRNWWGFWQIDESRGGSWQLSVGNWMDFIRCPKYKCRYLFRHGNTGFAAFSIVFGELCWGSCGSFASHCWVYGVRSCFFRIQKATAAGCGSRGRIRCIPSFPVETCYSALGPVPPLL